MATFVLVHGGGHGGWCYQPVARILKDRGHDVYAPSLSGLADREHLLSPAVDLDMHITDIVKLLHYEDIHDAIVVGHSYGGMVITGVADRATDRVGHLVYLDAAWPTNGESLADHAGPIMAAARQFGRVVDGMELLLFPNDDPRSFYGVTDPEQMAWMRARLTPHPWACFEQKLVLTNEEATAALPQTHIICTETIPGRDMPALHARCEGRVWDIDTGHDLMITEPQKTADLLLRVAAL